MRCSHCGIDNQTGMNFCGGCGSPVIESASDAPAYVDPPQRIRPEGERRVVTVLFADICGFTSLSERLDPETLREIINACFERLVPCVEEHGGTVDKFIGDAIMALFGAPVSHDNDAERAIRAALEMQRALTAFSAAEGLDLALHTGINTGLALAGSVGGGHRVDYSVMGDPVNVASRLEEQSGPGEILIGPDTHRLAGHLIECEPAGEIRLRGRQAPLSVWRVTGDSRVGDGSRHLGRALCSSLVGRVAERDKFQRVLGRTLSGEGGVLFVLGEAGLGKSRLTAEVRASSLPDVLWLEGRALSFGKELSYLPFREILLEAAGIATDDDDAARLEKLGALVERVLGREKDAALPVLGTLLSLSLPEDLEERVRYLDGELLGRQLVRTLGWLFRALAEERPLVLVLEDVHWLDPSSLFFLEHLLPVTREAALMICLVGRPELDSPTTTLRILAKAACPERVDEIELGPLTSAEVRTLLHNLLSGGELPRGLREAVGRKAEGNPLFVEEVLRAFVDAEALTLDEHGELRVTEKAEDLPVPDGLNGVITARIDRLPQGPKEVLRAASVIGRVFSRRLLAAVIPSEEDLADMLVQLEHRMFIRVVRPEPEVQYSFKHVLVQQAAYGGLLFRRRRELHREVAAATEALYPDRVDEFFGLLAYHYTKAEMWGKAQDFLLAAGHQAGRIAADPETLSHFEQAVEAHLRAHGGRWGDLVSEEGVDWFLQWTGALVEQQRLGAIVSLVSRFHQNVVESFGLEDPRTATVATILARAYLQQGSPAAAEALIEDFLTARGGMDDPDEVRIPILCCLATAKVHLDKSAEGEATLLEILQTLSQREDLRTFPDHARACHMLGALYLWTARFAEGRQVTAEGLASPGLRRGYVRDCLLTNLSLASLCLGDYAEAEEYARSLLEQAAQPLGRMAAWGSLGEICLAQGRVTEALEHFESAAMVAEQWGSPHQQFAQTWSGLAEALTRVGKPDAAEEAARRGLAMLEELPDYVRSAAVNPYYALAGVALARGELALAEAFLASCEAMGEALPEHYLRPEILYRKAQLRRRQDCLAEAKDLIQQACRMLDGWRGSSHPRAELMRND